MTEFSWTTEPPKLKPVELKLAHYGYGITYRAPLGARFHWGYEGFPDPEHDLPFLGPNRHLQRAMWDMVMRDSYFTRFLEPDPAVVAWRAAHPYRAWWRDRWAAGARAGRGFRRRLAGAWRVLRHGDSEEEW